MEIRYHRDAKKFIEKQDVSTRKRIYTGIQGLMQKPAKGDIKPLAGYSDGRLRLRVGKYRIVYRYFDEEKGENIIEVLFIIDIDSRGDIYKN